MLTSATPASPTHHLSLLQSQPLPLQLLQDQPVRTSSQNPNDVRQSVAHRSPHPVRDESILRPSTTHTQPPSFETRQELPSQRRPSRATKRAPAPPGCTGL